MLLFRIIPVLTNTFVNRLNVLNEPNPTPIIGEFVNIDRPIFSAFILSCPEFESSLLTVICFKVFIILSNAELYSTTGSLTSVVTGGFAEGIYSIAFNLYPIFIITTHIELAIIPEIAAATINFNTLYLTFCNSPFFIRPNIQ